MHWHAVALATPHSVPGVKMAMEMEMKMEMTMAMAMAMVIVMAMINNGKSKLKDSLMPADQCPHAIADLGFRVDS